MKQIVKKLEMQRKIGRLTRPAFVFFDGVLEIFRMMKLSKPHYSLPQRR